MIDPSPEAGVWMLRSMRASNEGKAVALMREPDRVGRNRVETTRPGGVPYPPKPESMQVAGLTLRLFWD